MTLLNLISNLQSLELDSVIYAKKVNGIFTKESEVVVIDLTEEELEWKIAKVIEKYCPGYDYFLESFLILEIAGDVDASNPSDIEEKCNQLIHYAEHDA